MGVEAPVWDAEVLARVRHLHMRARHLTDALLTGPHRSRRVGQAIEFADYQEYVPGMDLRGLDWRVWGRSDRLVVRRYEAETELPCTLVVDLSGDLGTGETTRTAYPPLEGSKAGYAIMLAGKHDLDVGDIVRAKMEKNRLKYPVEKAKGSSAKYADL